MAAPIIAGAIAVLPALIGALDSRVKKKDIRSKEQKALDKKRGTAAEGALDRLLSEIEGLDMESFKERRRGIFEREVAPQLKEQFAATSGLRGSDFLNALAGATVESEAQAEGDFYNQLNALLGMGAGQQLSPGQKTVATLPQSLAKGLAPASAKALDYATLGKSVQALGKGEEKSVEGGIDDNNNTG